MKVLSFELFGELRRRRYFGVFVAISVLGSLKLSSWRLLLSARFSKEDAEALRGETC